MNIYVARTRCVGGREGAGLKPTCELSFPTFACKIFAAGFQQRAAVLCSPESSFNQPFGFGRKQIPFCICRRNIYLFTLSQLILTGVELHVWCIFSFSSCFKQNIVVIVSRCSQKPACYRNDVAASCFTADCESSGLTLISYLFLKQKRRFSIKLLKICTCCLSHSLTFSVRHLTKISTRSLIWLLLVIKVQIKKFHLQLESKSTFYLA